MAAFDRVQNDDWASLLLDNRFRTISINFHDDLRYPHLERIAGKPDLLTKILAER